MKTLRQLEDEIQTLRDAVIHLTMLLANSFHHPISRQQAQDLVKRLERIA